MSRESHMNTDDIPVAQMPPLSDAQLHERPREVIMVGDKELSQDYMDELKFNDDPIEIIIGQGTERNAPTFQQAWNNGPPAKQLIDGHWVEVPGGYLALGVPITLQRKVVETLLRARVTNVSTTHEQRDQYNNPINRTHRQTSLVNPIQVLNGPGGAKHVKWMNDIMRRNY